MTGTCYMFMVGALGLGFVLGLFADAWFVRGR